MDSNQQMMINTVPVKNDAVPTGMLFFMLLSGLLLCTYLYNNIIMTREVLYNLYQDQLEIYRIDMFYELIRDYKIWIYPLTAIFFLIQQMIVALLLQLPLLFLFIEIRFIQIFRIVLYAYIPLLIMNFTQIIYFYIIPIHNINQETMQFIPLSLTNFLNPDQFAPHIYGFLGHINLFQIAWCIIVIKGLLKTKQLSMSNATLAVTGVWLFMAMIQFLILGYFYKIFGV